jgi:hypothetical protein
MAKEDKPDPMFDGIVRGAQEWNRKQQEKQDPKRK